MATTTSSSSSSVKVPVFIDTNLETHIAMAVSPEITAGDLKRDFRREHSICFPSLGEIRITGLMVKRKSLFYHLPDSMVIKNVFQGLKGIWFIRMDADLVKKSNNPSLSKGVAEIRGSDVNLSNVTEAQTHENHINGIDKNNMENTSRKMKKKITTRLEGIMEELLVPNYPSLSKGVAEIRGSDVNLSNVTEAQTHENHINGIDKNNTENTSREMKKKRTTRLEGIMEELLVPNCSSLSEGVAEIKGSDVNLGNVTETQTHENHISDIDKNNTENTSREMKKKRTTRLEGIMEELLVPNYPSLSEGVAEIKGSDVNLGNVTETQTHENHISDIDKNNTENTSREMKKKRTTRLEGLMEELLVPVSIGKKKKRKKTRIKEKCFNQEVVDEGKNKVLPTAEEEPVISPGKHFCNVDTTKEPNLREEQISPPAVGISTVSSSEIVSVTGIITRYFSEFDEVKSLKDHPGCDIGDELQSCIASQGHQDKSSKTVKAEHCRQPPEPHTFLSAKTLTRMLSHPLPTDPSPKTSRKEFGRTEVGKRLVLAANDLKISNSNKKSSTNIRHSRGGMFSPSVVRTLVFDVTDSDG